MSDTPLEKFIFDRDTKRKDVHPNRAAEEAEMIQSGVDMRTGNWQAALNVRPITNAPTQVSSEPGMQRETKFIPEGGIP